MTHSAPQAGDKIRVVIEAEVTDWEAQSAAVAANGGSLVSLEVLPKPFVLGDMLASADDYSRAPAGTVALDELSGVLSFKRSQNSWADSSDGFWYGWELHGPRKIVFLPDAS